MPTTFYSDQRVRVQHPKEAKYADVLGWITNPRVANGRYLMVLVDGELTDRRFNSLYVTVVAVKEYPDPGEFAPLLPGN